MPELFSEIVEIQNTDNQITITLDANGNTGEFGAAGDAGTLLVRDADNRQVFDFNGASATLQIGTTDNAGDLYVRDADNQQVFEFDGANAGLWIGAQGNEGDIRVRNNDGDNVIRLDGESGDIILSNADCAEDFDVVDTEIAESGTVMVLGEEGVLRPSYQAYDKRVAGVISGAGDYKPGIVVDKQTSQRERQPIALLGKVYCKVDAEHAPIEIGDLLTTSPTLGHAMKATDPLKAFGTVIGKALRPVREAQALIPILVTLQ